MAEEVAININVSGNTDKAVNSIKELRTELKKAESAALNGDGKAAKRVAELKEKMDNLRDSVSTVKGSGIERIESSFSLLGQGFKTFDFEKIKTGFSGIGKAMSAIPVFLIVEGIMYLVENFKELSEGSGVLAKVLRGIGDVLGWVGDKFNELTDWLGFTNSELDKMGDALKTNAEKAKEALSEQTAEYDRLIKAAKSAGKSTVDLEIAKQQAIIDTNKKLVEQTIAYVREGGVLNDEKKKLLTQQLNAIKDAVVDEHVIIDADHKDKLEKVKKHNDDLKKERERAYKEQQDALGDIAIARKTANDLVQDDEKKAQADIEAKRAAASNKEFEDLVAAGEKEKALDLARLEGKKAIRNAEFAAAEQAIGLIATLFSKNEKIANAAFLLDKALAIGKIIVTTRSAMAANSAAGAAASIPTGGASVIAAEAQNAVLRITSAAGIATIIATTLGKFGGGGSGGGSGSLGGGGQVPTGQAPVIQTPTNSNSNIDPITGQVKNNQQQSQKVYVLETDITKNVKQIATIKETATF